MAKVLSKSLMYWIYGPGCFYCDAEVAETVDHVIPRFAGGSNSPGNKVPACYECNFLKDRMPLEHFLEVHADRIRDDFDPLYKFRQMLDDFGDRLPYRFNRPGRVTSKEIHIPGMNTITKEVSGECNHYCRCSGVG